MKAAIIGASSESLHTIQKAKEYNLTVVALDGNEKAEGLAAADEAIVVNISKEEETIRCIEKENIDFVLTVPIGRYLTTIGSVNDTLNLPGIGKKQAMYCTDKLLFHQKMEENGLRDCICLEAKEAWEEREKLLNTVKKLDNINLQLFLECFYELYEENIDIINEEYSTKSRCQSAVESELRKKYNSISGIFNAYSSNSLDKKAFNEIKSDIEPIFAEIEHHSQILMDITNNESFSEIINIADIELYRESLQQSLNEQLKDSYFSIKPFEHYSRMLEYESFSFEEGLLGSLTATWSCENFYEVDIYEDAQATADIYAKYANSIVCEKISIKIKNKIEEIVVKVFPDINLYQPENITVKTKPIKKRL